MYVYIFYNKYKIFRFLVEFSCGPILRTSSAQGCISQHRSSLSQYAFYFTRQSASQKWSTMIMSIFLIKRIISSWLENAKITWYCGQETVGVTRKASKVPAMSVEYWFSIVGHGNHIAKILYFKVSLYRKKLNQLAICNYYIRSLV